MNSSHFPEIYQPTNYKISSNESNFILNSTHPFFILNFHRIVTIIINLLKNTKCIHFLLSFKSRKKKEYPLHNPLSPRGIPKFFRPAGQE